MIQRFPRRHCPHALVPACNSAEVQPGPTISGPPLFLSLFANPIANTQRTKCQSKTPLFGSASALQCTPPYLLQTFNTLTPHSHQDDAAKEDKAQHPELKHSYVISMAELSSPATPTSQTHIVSKTPQPPSPVVLPPQSPAFSAFSQPSSPILQSSPGRKSLRKAPKSPLVGSNPFARHGNSSQLTLGLSGRPQSRFKFWTSVTADPTNRDSWLEGQRRKKRHRAWVCWIFWLALLIFVGGIVAAILVLRSKHII